MEELANKFQKNNWHIIFGMFVQIGFMFFYFGQQNKEMQQNLKRIEKLETTTEAQNTALQRIGVLEVQQTYTNGSLTQIHSKIDKLTEIILKERKNGK